MYYHGIQRSYPRNARMCITGHAWGRQRLYFPRTDGLWEVADEGQVMGSDGYAPDADLVTARARATKARLIGGTN